MTEETASYDLETTECHSTAPFDYPAALQLIKLGYKAKRAGWNGKGIFVALQLPDENSFMTKPYLYIDTTGLKTDNPDAAKGRIPWVPSQTDMQASDWILAQQGD